MKLSKNIFWLLLIAAAVLLGIWGLNFWSGGCASAVQESVATTTSSSNGTITTITLPSYTSEFLYVENGLGISSYNLDLSTGKLTSVESISDPGGISFICTDPSSKFLFVGGSFGPKPPAFSGDYEIQSYKIDPSSGVLSSPDAMVVSKQPISADFDPAGNFVYIGGGTNLISIYRLNASSGGITLIESEEPGGSSFLHVAVEPGGKYAYACGQNGANGNIWVLNINSLTGDLNYIDNIDTGSLTNPINLIMNPAGKFMYVLESFLNDILVYQIDETTGKLSLIQTELIGNSIEDIKIDPLGRFLYVVKSTYPDFVIKVFRIAPTTGKIALSQNINVLVSYAHVSADPSGKFVCLSQIVPNQISVYRLDPTAGSLTLVDSLGTINSNVRSLIVGIK